MAGNLVVSESRKAARKLHKKKMNKNQLLFVIVCLTPILGVLFTFSLLPIFGGGIISFLRYNPYGASTFSGFQNYINVFAIDKIGRIFFNSFLFAFVTSFVNILLTLFLAYLIASVKWSRLKGMFRCLLFMPVVLPMVAVAYITIVMLDPSTGIINRFIAFLGYTQPIYWLQEPGKAMLVVIAVTIFMDFGFNMVLFLVGLENIPKTFEEAARMDGASRWHLFSKIQLPLLSRTMLFVSTMTVISYFQVFAQIHILTQGGPDSATSILSTKVYDVLFVSNDYGTGSALAVLLMIVVLILTLMQLKFGKSDWEY